MAKAAKSTFICQECGGVHPRWSGKCDACGAWNSIQEETSEAGPPKGLGSTKTAAGKGRVLPFTDLQAKGKTYTRHHTGMSELDRVTGGGIVPGGAILIGGDPGIGKSTLLLQLVCSLAMRGLDCAYISGEEAEDQIRMRASRLGLMEAPVRLASATSVRDIVSSMDSLSLEKGAVLVIDSIQTMYVDTVDSAPGTVTQVRTATQELIRAAKRRGVTLLIVGHVTKEGTIAGPRVLEHMVDTVLYFEGDRGHQFRILRAVKNRFGPADEIGVFEMAEMGLKEIANPSALFLPEREDVVAGSAILAGMEGSRPVLVEVQALVAPTAYATPRRSVVGWDTNRLAMILAVLEARCGVMLSEYDVYLNMAGGLRVGEPAADLAVAAALISAVSGEALPCDTVVFGEIGLSGEVRPVPQSDIRLKESAKLGFTAAFMPAQIGDKQPPKPKGLKEQKTFKHLSELVSLFPSGH